MVMLQSPCTTSYRVSPGNLSLRCVWSALARAGLSSPKRNRVNGGWAFIATTGDPSNSAPVWRSTFVGWPAMRSRYMHSDDLPVEALVKAGR
jgi:hypothetical protein